MMAENFASRSQAASSASCPLTPKAAFILMPAGDKAAHKVHDSIDAKGAGAHVADGADKPEHESEEHENARDLVRKEREAGERTSVSFSDPSRRVPAGP